MTARLGQLGTQVRREAFSDDDYARFRDRLEECLSELGSLLERPGFGAGPTTVGAELEMFLIDGAARPLPLNQAVRSAAADRRITLELNRYNLELNATPTTLAGRPFTALGNELSLLLELVTHAAGGFQGRPVLIGILPTLTAASLSRDMMTDAPRYRALDSGLRRLRQGDQVRVVIAGTDRLDLVSDDVLIEGANTSFQVHLRVAPADFARVYNAVQLATVPVLAVSGNSPTFLGQRLWDETRIALYKQAVDDRGQGLRRRPSRTALGTGWVRGGAIELFTQSVRLYEPLLPVLSDPAPRSSGERWRPPPLDELRLHQGTVWQWNRPIYDPSSGGHLRIEMRALPAGPTMIDMQANASFLIGLSLWLADQDPQWTYAVPFERASHGFHRAAQHGLSAQLPWPAARRDQARTVPAAELIAELVPAARQGLIQAGVEPGEADRFLGVIAARAASGQTGAAWQRATLARAEQRLDRHEALAEMLHRYLRHADTGQPVHTWPTNDP